MWGISIDQIIVLSLAGLACAYDLKSGRVPNFLVILSFLSLQTYFLINVGWGSLIQTAIAMGVLVVALIPTYIAKAIGGGDVKLLLSFAPIFTLSSALGTIFYTLIWGAIFSVAVILLNKKSKQTFENLKMMLFRLKLSSESTTKVPFTVAILLGIISQWEFPITWGLL